MRQILVTSALPYANGPIHLGHLVEYLQTDIWVRFQKLRGSRCIYVCADDTHGTAIMIRARQEGTSEEELIARMQKAHEADFAGFEIEFDNYGSTNSPENRAVLRRDLGCACARPAWSASRKSASFTTRRPAPFWPIASSWGPAPIQVQVAGPVRRQLRQVRHALQCGRTDRPGEHALRSEARGPHGQPPLRQHRAAARLPRAMGDGERGIASGSGQLPQGPLPRRAAARLGRVAAGALFRLRDPRQSGQLLVRLVRRPHRLPGLDAAVVRRVMARSSTTGGGARPPRSTTSSARTSPTFHTLFWPAMLKTAGFQPADEGPHPRIPHRQRREDVEERRAPSSARPRTWSTSTRPTCVITTPRSSPRTWTTST